MESCVNREERRALAKNKKVDKSKPARILWASNAPWASTGYGTQTSQVTTRLKKHGHQVAIAANYGLEANSTNWNTPYGDIKIYPRGHEIYSNDIVPAHMYDWSQQDPEAQNLLITLFDVWVFRGDKWADWNVASWTPIDHLPAPPDVMKWCKNKFVTPIAMSKYGQKIFENSDVESLYVPHAIEPVFKPTTEIKFNGEVLTSRQLMGIPEDKFVVGMNAANKGVMPNRKAFGENILAFSMFAQKHRDVVLYLHTEASGSLGGINLRDLILSCGIPQDQVIFADPYLLRSGMSQEMLASVYTGMDVLLATSYGEGFGIPTVESLACSTPVIVSNFAASAELCGDGWLIGGQPLWNAPQKAWFHLPSVPEIVDALEQAYNRGRVKSEKAVEFAKQYDADTVYETHWKPALAKLLA
jgi:glycosyltransferase involved in cell wall biosynthesis